MKQTKPIKCSYFLDWRKYLFFLQPDSSTCGPLTCDNLCQAFLKLFNIHYWHHTCTKTCQIFCQNATLLRISKVCPEHSELSFDTKFVSIRPHTAEILGHLLILAFLLCNFFFYLISAYVAHLS